MAEVISMLKPGKVDVALELAESIAWSVASTCKAGSP